MRRTADAVPLRVLHCPMVVGGNAQQLARAEREVGLRSWAVALDASPYGYQSDEILCGVGAGPVRKHLALAGLLWRALREYEVVHFNFGRTFFPHVTPRDRGAPRRRLGVGSLVRSLARGMEFKDLAALRAARKAVFVTFQGDDVRQGDFCRANFEVSIASEVDPAYYSEATDRLKRRRVQKFAEFADRVYALNPDLMHVLPRGARFLPYSHIDLREWGCLPSDGEPAVPRVVHAPSHAQAKGTRFILEAVERLRQEGVAFEFRLIEGLSRDEARREYERADLLVDQLLAGWYGGLTVELMALGKPAVCYIREGDLRFVPPEMRDELPVINAAPDSIYHVLREWLTSRRAELRDRGVRSRAFVERWHDPLVIARQMEQEYHEAWRARRSDP
jgi:glycosyltransferase involved in cell wall biosynthesis